MKIEEKLGINLNFLARSPGDVVNNNNISFIA